MTRIPFDSLTPHPEAIALIDFGDYADYDALYAALVSGGWTGTSDYGTSTGGTTAVDSTQPFNTTRRTLKYTNGTGTYGNLDITPTALLWYRFWVWFDASSPATRSEDRFPNDVLFYGKGSDSLDNPLDCFKAVTTYAGDTDTFDVQYDDESGRWVPILVLENLTYDSGLDQTTQRIRAWSEGGAKILDVTDSIPQSGEIKRDFVSCWFENFGHADDTTTYIGFVEYITDACPYSGLSDYDGCPPEGTPQWGGVTAWTKTFENGSLNVAISLGGQPKGKYKSYRSLGTRKLPPPRQPIPPVTITPPVFTPGTLQSWSEFVSWGSGVSYIETANMLPANVNVLNISTRVSDTPGGTTTMDVGIASDTDKAAAGISTTATGVDNDGTDNAPWLNSTAQSVRITFNAPTSSAGGTVLVNAWFEVA